MFVWTWLKKTCLVLMFLSERPFSVYVTIFQELFWPQKSCSWRTTGCIHCAVIYEGKNLLSRDLSSNMVIMLGVNWGRESKQWEGLTSIFGLVFVAQIFPWNDFEIRRLYHRLFWNRLITNHSFERQIARSVRTCL